MTEKRILVVSPSWVGDIVMSQTLFSLLKQTDPSTRLDVMAPSASKPLLSRMANVDNALLFDVGHGEMNLGYRRAFARDLSHAHYDQAIILPNSFKSALVPFFAKIPLRTGYRGEMRYKLLNDMRILDKATLPRMIDRFMALGMASGKTLPKYSQPSLLVDPKNQDDCIKRFDLNKSKVILGICPGAEFGDAKRWSEHKFALVAKAVIEYGMQVWLFGSARDRVITDKICKMLPSGYEKDCTNLAGRTTLLDALDLINLCDHVVTNDSGLMHVASAVGCKIVVLYGSTSPEFTPPLTSDAAVIKKSIICSPCFKRECPLEHKNCLNLIEPNDVLVQLGLQ